ncbi:secretin and TonB N-terminal domain-containing protein [Bradyrhizobium sp. Leo170]|uniref:secretin and TonB N-terminal domain-containing protein n=1 Tax=Bradyrhizobium sp. Leo170 TaxID=1571199 RepID=UPI00102E46A7|nr:secretin and TonB N-terminal domain-containing protein [Bradyrhizobium sp. Leo170]
MVRRTALATDLACVLVASLLLAWSSVCVLAQPRNEATQGGEEVVFDIPSQPLAAALSAYGAITGVQVLYETALAAGKTSAAIKGSFAQESALRVLLAGTGLVGRRTDVDAITIAPALREQPGSAALVAPDARFLGALQAGVLGALCGNTDTQPGGYRMALQLWITPAGVLQRASLLGSTGNAHRDEALIAQLQNVRIAVFPPAGMTQPVTLTIVPRSPLQSPECSGGR